MAEQLAAGWYHGEGDPPGTVRWWDGAQWVGEAVMPAGGPTRTNIVYASWGQRFAALLIDSAVVLALFVPVIIVALIAASINEALGAIIGIVGYLAAIVAAFWLIAWGQGTTGQSPGKRVMGIELVRDRTYVHVGGGTGIGRYFLSFVNSLPLYLGWLWPLWDAKNQTLVDKILGTVVIKTDRPTTLFPLFPGGKPF